MLLSFLILLSVSASFLYISWPYLYDAPVSKLAEVFGLMSRFDWNGEVLFLGEKINSRSLPWNYIVSWFLIANPIPYLILGFSGMMLFCFRFVKNPLPYFTDSFNRNSLLYFACMTLPVFAVILLHSVVYDGWRHLFFIYPGFIFFAVLFIQGLQNQVLKWVITGLTFISLVSTASYMVIQFPHFHVYFNSFVRKNEPEQLRKYMELDYWGLSYRQGLEYILANDPNPEIHVNHANPSGDYNLQILKPEQRSRILLEKFGPEADYFITNYRWHPQDYDIDSSKIYYSVKISNSSVLTVFKLK